MNTFYNMALLGAWTFGGLVVAGETNIAAALAVVAISIGIVVYSMR